MEQNLFKYIWKYSRLQQISALALIIASFPFLYYSMDLPKTIVNEAIDISNGNDDFSILGYQFTQLEFLFALCGIFLILVLINGAFKYQINIYKGIMSERLLRRLRYMLIERSLRFPLPQFQKTSSGEIVTMVTAEVEPLGGFFGDAFALLAFQGGTFITIMAFMFMQDPWLGLAAFASIPIQGYIIPKLQKHINQLGKERVRYVRSLSNRINEMVNGIEDIHAQDHAKYILSDISKRLGNIFWVRFDIYKRKFFMKFLNNLIGQMTPFFFYSIGGYLVIQGNLTFGALLAALAAYKDLASPWKELLNYYQRMADAKIKYEQLHNQFVPVGMLAEKLLLDEPKTLQQFNGKILNANNLIWADDDGIRPIDGLSFKLLPASINLIISQSGASRDVITKLLSRLLMPTGGMVDIGGINLSSQHEALTGRQIGIISSMPSFLNDDIAANIFMGLMNKPPEEAQMDDIRKQDFEEAIASGNNSKNSDLDWINYSQAKVSGYEELLIKIEQLLYDCQLDQDFYELGLRLPIEPDKNLSLIENILIARAEIKKYLNENGMDDLVKNYHIDQYNDYSPIAENILFGKPTCDEFALENLPKNPIILKLLQQENLIDIFLEKGIKCAALMVDLFKDLPSGHAFYEQYSFVKEERMDDLKHLVSKINQHDVEAMNAEEKEFIMTILFKLTPQRHRLGLIDDQIREKIIKIRHKLHKNHPELFKDKIQPFHNDSFNRGLSIKDNMLFGRIAYGRAGANQKVMAVINDITKQHNMRSNIIRTAFNYQVGIGGSKLSITQRQKISLVRNLIKNPDILIINDGLNMIDNTSQAWIVNRIKNNLPDAMIIWISNVMPEGISFTQHLEIKDGKLTVAGDEKDIIAKDSLAKTETIQIDLDKNNEHMILEREIEALKNIPIFANLDSSKLKFLAFTSERKTYKSNEILFHQGDIGNAAYVILSGKADIVLEGKDGAETVLFQLGKNKLVGELALLNDSPRSATIRAASPLVALRLNKEIFTELAHQDAHFAFEMARDMSERLIKTTTEVNVKD